MSTVLGTTYNRSIALIFAIDEYESWPSLSNAVRGANALAELFATKFNFEVITFFNNRVSREAVLGALDSLNCHANDRVIIYFAGHGIVRRRGKQEIGYLAMPSSQPNDYHTSLNIDDLLGEADALSAKHVLLILDACFSGTALLKTRGNKNASPRVNDVQQLVDELISRPVRYALTAGGNEPVDDNAAPDGNFSLFTYYLVNGLNGAAADSNGLLRAKTLGTYLEQQVGSSSLTAHKPNHGYFSSIGDGDFVFEYIVPKFGGESSRYCVIHDPKEMLDQKSVNILQHLTKSSLVTLLEEVRIGQSGSGVYLVDVVGQDKSALNGLHFCKIYRTPTGDESRLHETARNTGISAHIPRLVDFTPVIDGWIASIYAVAHNTTLRGSQPLSRLISTNFLGAIEGIKETLQLINRWNSTPTQRGYLDPHELLRFQLQRANKSSDTADIDVAEKVNQYLGDVSERQISIQFADQVLPNPIAFLNNRALWRGCRAISWPKGNVHGDLHTDNIICLIDAATSRMKDTPAIIDFDTYRENSCIFFDLAYLELDICMRVLSPCDEANKRAWLSLSSHLARSVSLIEVPPLPPIVVPLNLLIVPIRATVYHLCEQQGGDFEAAYWISRASAGLSFARKRKISTADRKLMLLASAQSLQKALVQLEIDYQDFEQPLWMKWLDD